MNREQLASHEAQHDTSNQEVESEEASDLPPSILWRAKALGPGDGEKLKTLLRQYPELMVEIARVVAHPMGNRAVTRVVEEMKQELAASSIGPARRASADTIDGSDSRPTGAPKSGGELQASDHAVIGPARRESADTIDVSGPNPTTAAGPVAPSSEPRQWRANGDLADVAPANRAPAREFIEGSGPNPMAPPSWAQGKEAAPDHAATSHQANGHEADAEASAPSMPAVAGAGHGRVTALGLNVRSSPHAGSRGNIIGSLRRGDQVEIIGRDGAWLQITFQGQLAFVHSGYVEREAAKPATPDAEPGGPSQPLDGKPASFGPTQDATNIGDDIQR